MDRIGGRGVWTTSGCLGDPAKWLFLCQPPHCRTTGESPARGCSAQNPVNQKVTVNPISAESRSPGPPVST
jgi:hypothetical protein